MIDAAEVLEPENEAALTQSLAQLETDTLVQLVVVTTPDLLGYDISDYSRMLGNAWGIGDAERNDGLLIVVAPNERKVRIQVGLGLESTVTDEEARKIIETGILPAFGRGDYSAGISEGVERLLVEVSQPELREAA
ncbi:TPM domain-containing protein [Altererythrobacter sp. GH1-8]|uniref:TPM domain-containing protein n=1 Tax=Altererythrobacter sp. GH1-8 TaxID=3349333 RepID=UPI00374CF113